MFFDFSIFGIHKKASFSHCWVAATNPKLFKSSVLGGKMDGIGISTLCDEMRVELTAGLMNSTQRVPLYFAAQMVYGAVRIYQQQVQALYEQTNKLFSRHNATMRELMLKRRRYSDENYQGKKQKLPLDLAEDAKQYEIALPDIKGEDVCELLCHDSQAGKPQDLLIHEKVNDDVYIIDDDEDFGVITEAEMRSLLDALRTEDLFSKDTQRVSKNKKKKVQDVSETILNEHSPTQNLGNELHREVDLVREAIREEETMPLMISFQDIPDPNNSIQIDESTIENMRPFGLQSPLIENIDTGGDQPTAVVVPDQPGLLDELTLTELIVPKRKRKTPKLKLDTCTKISYNDFIKQFDYSKTMRCLIPIMDIVSPYRMSLKESSRLFNMPTSNLGSKELLKAFNRNLKTKVTEIDAKILDHILDTESADFEAVNPVIRRNSRRLASCPRNDLNRRGQTDESFATVLNPFEVTNALEITTNALEPALSKPNSVEDPLYLRLKEDLLKDFEGEKDRREDSNLCNSTELNRSQWGKELVIRRLLHLWKNKVEALTMKLLCHGVQRKDAAYAFHCLLELNARHYVELERNTETNEINNIEMGVKVLKRLNETFK